MTFWLAPGGAERITKMKKIVLTMVAVMTMSMAYATNENTTGINDSNVKKEQSLYDMSVDYTKLAMCLGLDLDQIGVVKYIHGTFCKDMKIAATATEEERRELTDKAIARDLQYMRYVLTDRQYQRYDTLLSNTLHNRGLVK